MQVDHLVSELLVADCRKSVAFYQHLLGFELVATEEEHGRLDWAKLGKDGFYLSFKETRKPLQTGAFSLLIQVSDIHATYAEVKKRMKTLNAPHLTPCGATAFSLKDPNGYTISFEMF